MTDAPDLRTALTQIVAGAADAHTARHEIGADLPLPAIRTAARRRRTRFEAGIGAAAAAVIAAVVLAGSAVGGALDRDPVPPVDTVPGPSSPTPEPSPDALPSAVTLGRPVTCQEPLPAVLTPDGDPELTLEATVPATLTTGDRLVVDYALVLPETAVPTMSVDRPVLAVMRDGVVVATGTTPEAAVTGPQAELDLVTCDTAEPLGPGDYEVYLVQPLLRLVDGTVTDEALLVVAGPHPLALEAPFDPHPPLEALTITTSGLGPLTVGLPPGTNPGAAMIEFDPDYCAQLNGGEWDTALGPVGEWVVVGYEQAFGVAVADDVVAQIAVVLPELRTAEGIGWGSSLAALLDAYPGLVELTTESPWAQEWMLQGETGNLFFETAHPDYGTDVAEHVVVGITIAAPGHGLATSWGSGAFPGNCGIT